MIEEYIINFFHNYAYQPEMVYLAVILLMLGSSFGLPLPEELTLVTSGFMAFIGLHPTLFPPPSPEATVVNVHVLAVVAFFAVFGSDLIVYGIGRVYGTRLLRSQFMSRFLKESRREQIERWTGRYGHWAAGMFRFTPGVRFPGHVACGATGLPLWKFAAVDGSAALISVPTQIYLVAYYGKEILAIVQPIKFVILGGMAAVVFFFIGRALWRAQSKRRSLHENSRNPQTEHVVSDDPASPQN
jgi:membrane protein DedA with SNARE-associated domain